MNNRNPLLICTALFVLASCGADQEKQLSPGAPPVETSTSSVDAPTVTAGQDKPAETTIATNAIDEAQILDISKAEDLLPTIDLAGLASAGIAVEAAGLSVRSAAGLSRDASPVGNDICLIVSSLEVETGRLCASAADVGGLIVFTQEWDGGFAAVVLTASNVAASVDGCKGQANSATSSGAILTVCPSLESGLASADFRIRTEADGEFIVSTPLSGIEN